MPVPNSDVATKKNRTPRRQLQLIIISENFATLVRTDSARMFQ